MSTVSLLESREQRDVKAIDSNNAASVDIKKTCYKRMQSLIENHLQCECSGSAKEQRINSAIRKPPMIIM